jgi:hypothetical protein
MGFWKAGNHGESTVGFRRPKIKKSLVVAEPFELFSFNCVDHHYTGDSDLNALQTEQSNGLSGNVPMKPSNSGSSSVPRTKVSPEIQLPSYCYNIGLNSTGKPN